MFATSGRQGRSRAECGSLGSCGRRNTPQDMRVPMTVRFSNQLVADLIQPFWAAWQAGEFMTDALSLIHISEPTRPY